MREQILSMQPGKELDELVGDRIMKAVPEYDGHFKLHGYRVGVRWYSYLPFYSTDISAAWEVVEKFEEISVRKYTVINGQSKYVCKVYANGRDIGDAVSADTPTEAICKAALLVAIAE